MFPADTRILIIDDAKAMRMLIKEQLKVLGFTNLIEAENGAEAWATLTVQVELGQPIQLVLSDWNMPEMTGIELLAKVRAVSDLANLPFIMITAEGEASSALKAIQSGVTHFIIKPFTPATLAEKIQFAWRKHHAGK